MKGRNAAVAASVRVETADLGKDRVAVEEKSRTERNPVNNLPGRPQRMMAQKGVRIPAEEKAGVAVVLPKGSRRVLPEKAEAGEEHLSEEKAVPPTNRDPAENRNHPERKPNAKSCLITSHHPIWSV